MTDVLDSLEQPPLVVRTSPVFQMDEDEFFQFCQVNELLRIERSPRGELIFHPFNGASHGMINADLTSQVGHWADRDGSGTAFGACTGFILPNSAVRAPDVSWVSNIRLAPLTDKEWQQFPPLCPDFVLELRSASDCLHILKEKMDEYVTNGARLGWLIDPLQKKVHIYRPDSAPEILSSPITVSGEDVLPNFVLELPAVWSPWP